jgi:hypothetical protein
MFGYVVAAVTAAVFGGIAYKEVTKPTGEKVKDGDTVFVRADAIHLADTSAPNDVAGLQAFLASFLNTSVKVTTVRLTPKSHGLTGTILGFPRVVAFDRSAVTSIERNGARIV